MSLLGWQTALGRMVTSASFRARARADGAPVFAPFALDEAARGWLTRLAHAPGFAFTCSIQASWCELRARSAARLTMAALPEGQRQDILATWLARGGGTGSFFASETVAFLEFVASQLPPDSHLASICRMEQAAHRASQAARDVAATQPSDASSVGGPRGPVACAPRDPVDASNASVRDPATCVERHPAASLVVFHAAPEAVLAAAFGDAPWPAHTDDAYVLLFAPGLPALCRRAQPDEAAMFEACAPQATVAALRAIGSDAALVELCRIGALVAPPSR